MGAMAVASMVASVLLAFSPGTEGVEAGAVVEADASAEALSAAGTWGGRCDSGYSGYYWTVTDRFTGDESYAVYCDPYGCGQCSGDWRPISVTIYLYWEYENDCALTVHSAVTTVDQSDPAKPVPGSVICESEPRVVGPFSPPGLWEVNVPLPEDCNGIDGPFFATLVFEDTCEELPALAADLNPCEDGNSLNDSGSGWRGVCEGGFPGNLSMFATLECLQPSAVQPASWTTIKDVYRADD